MKDKKFDANETAQLAKIRLTESECEKMEEEISDALNLFEVLDEISSDESAEDYQEAVLRKDEAKESFDREDIMKNAPESKEGFIIVPRTVG